MKTLSYSIIVLISLIFLESCQHKQSQTHEKPISVTKQHLDSILTQWHEAAKVADFETYFGTMADSSIFIGTDASENWTKEQFMEYSKPIFAKGRAWNFYAKKRNIYISDYAAFAWFDEELVTPNLGPCRGSGVFTFENNAWEIKHYTLSLSIPNDIVKDIAKQVVAFEEVHK